MAWLVVKIGVGFIVGTLIVIFKAMYCDARLTAKTGWAGKKPEVTCGTNSD